MIELPADWVRQNDEVYYSTAPIVTAGPSELALLKRIAGATPRLRSRLCTHPDAQAPLHEMLIIHHREVYVRPHRHLGKPESCQLVEGEATAVTFDDHGKITRRITMRPPGSDGAFYYRMPERVWHCLLIESEWLVFHEVTMGPFEAVRTEFPIWAPDGSDPKAARSWLASAAGLDPS
jgi:cupin fold WbuC family metalloprotein